ncbi:MAG: folylpolyglutamate synthase/dihydrofolate synthase family protein [Ferruginibacter sp.]
MMTYKETVDYLYRQLPMFSHVGSSAYKKDLHNTIALCESLGNPHRKFKTIHVAGTNGKGSTSHMLAAVLQEAGFKTGLYTSPHINSFRERIRVNGVMIEEQFITAFVEKTKPVSEKIQPSFFELTVAMAFEYFSIQEIDIAVIETGMGGLLDSTNVITPILSVITNIGYDHQQILGNTLVEIAEQKAGIIKENVPVIIGETLTETHAVFTEAANKTNSKIIFVKEDYLIEYIEPAGTLLLCNIKNVQTNVVEKLRLGLAGMYQAKNAAAVLAAVAELNRQGLTITETHLHTGLEKVSELTGLRGRWEILQNHPHIIADAAHNRDGIEQVLQQLQTVYPDAALHFVIGFVKDKDIAEILKMFPDNARYYFTHAHIPRALPSGDLKEKATHEGLEGDAYENVNDAVAAAKKIAGKDDVIMICGSFFILSELTL